MATTWSIVYGIEYIGIDIDPETGYSDIGCSHCNVQQVRKLEAVIAYAARRRTRQTGGCIMLRLKYFKRKIRIWNFPTEVLTRSEEI
jgi:hypothetical protein